MIVDKRRLADSHAENFNNSLLARYSVNSDINVDDCFVSSDKDCLLTNPELIIDNNFDEVDAD